MLSDFQLAFGFLDPQVATLQSNVQNALRPVLNVPFLDGVVVSNVALQPSVVTNVPTGLNRAWVGWFVIDKTAGVHVWRATSAVVPNTLLALTASAAVNVNIWVF